MAALTGGRPLLPGYGPVAVQLDEPPGVLRVDSFRPIFDAPGLGVCRVSNLTGRSMSLAAVWPDFREAHHRGPLQSGSAFCNRHATVGV